tara:strand:+ start:96 stop:659 length:564 start_codon:yes stop_codon:yes gene_type:complete
MSENDASQQVDSFLDDKTRDLFDNLWNVIEKHISGVSITRVDDEEKMSKVDLIISINKTDIINLFTQLRKNENLSFDYLRCLTAVDLQDDGVEVVYQLYSMDTKFNLTVKSMLSNDDLNIESVTSIWRGANWHERETSEMFGIIFNNHPDPRNLLLPEDMLDVFPLRKSHPLAEIEVLQGEDIEPSN